MQSKYFKALFAMGIGATLAGPAFAHVTLAPKEAQAGSDAEIAFNVPHGCDGSATTALRIKVPDSVTTFKPQPKAGWTVDVKPGEVGWSGGRLPDKVTEAFRLQAVLPANSGATLYFPVVQECEKGVHRWIEIPQSTQPSERLRDPAPALKLTPKAP